MCVNRCAKLFVSILLSSYFSSEILLLGFSGTRFFDIWRFLPKIILLLAGPALFRGRLMAFGKCTNGVALSKVRQNLESVQLTV